MGKQTSLIFILAILLFSLFLFSCDCEDDDDNDDDTDTDDDDDDDDTTDDDDDDDDDAVDDDDDDDDDDNVLSEDPYIEAIDGGAPGMGGTSIVAGQPGTDYIAAVRGRKLRLYTVQNGTATSRSIDPYAAFPDMAIDEGGNLHIAYHDTLNEDLKYTTNAGKGWTISTVDSAGNVGVSPSIAIGPGGSVHISYCMDSGNIWTPCDDLRYATNQSGVWTIETVHQLKYAGVANDIAIDNAGHAHISYGVRIIPEYYGTSTQMYATNASGYWTTTIVDTRDTGFMGSIALDSTGTPHIAYNYFHQPFPDFYYHQLIYAYKNGLLWTKKQIGFGMGGHPMIRIDSSDEVHIVAYASGLTANGVKYITHNGQKWVWQNAIPVPEANDVGNMDFYLDPNAKTRLSYYNDEYGHLKHRTNDTGAWVPTDVDLTGMVLASNATRDEGGNLHIAYTYGCGDFVHCLRYASNASGQWEFQEVESTPRIYDIPFIKVHSDGSAHIIAQDYHPDALIYYTNQSGTWDWEYVDVGVTYDVREMPALAIDPDGKAHVAYITYTSSTVEYRLYYATNESGTWIQEMIDPTNNAFPNTSIALDADGYVHIVYQSTYPRHATNAGGAWATEIIDPASGYGENNALIIDDGGNLHVSYCNYLGTNLRYATDGSGTWDIETVASPIWNWYAPTALAIDPDGYAHGFYGTYKDNRGILAYFNNEAGTWNNLEIDGAGEMGNTPSIVLQSDTTDWVHGVYTGEGALWYTKFEQGYAK